MKYRLTIGNEKERITFRLESGDKTIYEGNSIWPALQIMYEDVDFARECIMFRFNQLAQDKRLEDRIRLK